MAIYEVPLSATPQTFAITLGGVQLVLTVSWRNVGGAGWVLDVADNAGNVLLAGKPLVTGVDLLEQHRHLGIPGELWVQTDATPDEVPTFTNLGSGSHLYFVGAT